MISTGAGSEGHQHTAVAKHGQVAGLGGVDVAVDRAENVTTKTDVEPQK